MLVDGGLRQRFTFCAACLHSRWISCLAQGKPLLCIFFLQVKDVLAELEWADSASHDESCTLASVIANVYRSVL